MGEIEGWSQMGGGGGGGGRAPLLPNGLLPNAGPLIDSLDSERWLKAEERTAELISCIQPNPPSEERRNAVADYVQRLIMKCFPCKVFTFGSVPLKTYLPDGDIDLTAFSSNANLKDSWAIEVCDLLQAEEKNENAEFHVKEVQYIQAEVKIIKCLVENIVVDISFNQLGGLCTLCFLEEVDNLINQNHLFKRSIILIKAWCYYESRILGAHHGLISTYALETLVLYIFHVFNNSFAGPLEVVLYRFLEFFSKFDWDNFCVSLWGPVPISSLPDVTAEPPRKDSEELLLNKVFLDACSYVYAVFPGGQDNHGQPFLSKHFNVIDPLRVSNNLGRSVSKGNFYRIRSAFALGAKRLAKFLHCPKENLVAEVNQFFTNTWDRHGNGIRPDAPLPVTDSTVLNIDTKMSTSSGKKSETVGQESDFDHTRSTNNQSESSPKARVATPGQTNQGQRNLKSGLLVNDIQRSPFARTRSSPELTDTYKYVPFQGTINKPPENEKTRNRRKNVETENEKNEASSLHHVPHKQSFEPSPEPNIYHREDMQQEEQDLVNIMASSSFHGFNGPVNLASGHLPFPFSPSFLASLGYTQRNIPGMIPSNMPFIDPQFAAMHFPHGLVPHYFPGVDVTSNSEDSVNENNLGSVEINSGDDNYNHEILREAERVNSEIVSQDENKPQSSSTRMNYIPPPRRVGASGGLVVRSQHKNNKEKRDRLRENNHLDSSHSLENNINDAYSDERATSSRFSSAAHSSSLRSKTSSESSWDETSTVNKSTKGKKGKKIVNPVDLSLSDRFQSEDDDADGGTVGTVPPASSRSELEPHAVAPMHASRSPMPGIEPAQTSGSGSVLPMAPMIIGSNPRHRMMDNSGGTPLTFYPTGPPVPFLTMLPFYNVPSENGSSDASTSRFESTENGDVGQSFHPEGVDQVEDFSPRAAGRHETPDEHRSDILNSDFASHWQNLQFGRFCQSPLHHGPTVYPSPVMVPPVYLQGRVPWDGPGRPLPNMNLVTQLMNYGPRLVPVPPLQSVPNRPPNVYQHYVEDMPRYNRSGTGTYLPNPKVAARDRPRRGNFNYDRTDNHGDRDGNSKPRGSGRNHNHNQTDKSTARLDRLGSSGSRSMNLHRHESFSTYQTQNGPLHPGSSQSGPANVAYGMYPLPGVPPNGSDGPVVMMYPFEQNPGFASQNEPVDVGSTGPAGFSGVNDQSPRGDGSRYRGVVEEQRLYSPDQPSSPHHQRRV
ncbi:putative polynucleotide adenylyltransferase [Helianthus annuus]|nr:putative polynucleotide adenylyltransferase [Helianthus annuus]